MVRRSDDTLRCSFCGKSQNEVKKLIAGPTVYICNECIDICNEIISDDQQAESVASRPPLPKPGEIKAFLDEYVIGQDETKKQLAVAVYQHYKRIELARRRADVEIQKSNIVLIGPTGTGKTLLARRWRACSCAVHHRRRTRSPKRYVGEDAKLILTFAASNGYVGAPKRHHLIYDRQDFTARMKPSIPLDVSGEGVQRLLKFRRPIANARPGLATHPHRSPVDTTTCCFFARTFVPASRKFNAPSNKSSCSTLRLERFAAPAVPGPRATGNLIKIGLIPESWPLPFGGCGTG